MSSGRIFRFQQQAGYAILQKTAQSGALKHDDATVAGTRVHSPTTFVMALHYPLLFAYLAAIVLLIATPGPVVMLVVGTVARAASARDADRGGRECREPRDDRGAMLMVLASCSSASVC